VCSSDLGKREILVAFHYAFSHKEEELIDELIRYAYHQVGLTEPEIRIIYDAAYEIKFREDNEINGKDI
jgi:hypothetical protein